MSDALASTLLRPGLLARARVLFGPPPADRTLVARLEGLGAELTGDASPGLTAIVHDARGDFGAGGSERLQSSLSAAWERVSEAVNTGLLPSGEGGRIILIAPPPTAGAHAGAARDALENLARTLSIEWARFGVTAVAVAPGVQTAEEDLAELLAYLLSDAGGYFSGCRLDFG